METSRGHFKGNPVFLSFTSVYSSFRYKHAQKNYMNTVDMVEQQHLLLEKAVKTLDQQDQIIEDLRTKLNSIPNRR